MAKNFDEMLTEVFGAVDKIVEVRLQGLSFDKTILCEIVDDSQSSKGEYIVSDGTTRFFAYSKDDTYEEGNSVYIVIPNNDFSQQKTIIGKYRKSEDAPINYISPMESFIKGSDSYISTDNEYSILANGDVSEVLIWNWEKTPDTTPLKGYTVVGISAKFKTWLKDLDTASGNYGLRLEITNQKTEKEGDTNTLFCEFDSSSMYGDVYNYLAPITQESVFNISDLNEIVKMKLTLYQKDNFLSSQGDLISYLRKGVLKNIFVTSPKLYFGYNVNDYQDGDVILLSSKNLTYGKNNKNKDLYARWILTKNQIIDTEEEFEELQCATIHWYRYNKTPTRYIKTPIKDLVLQYLKNEIDIDELNQLIGQNLQTENWHEIISDDGSFYRNLKIPSIAMNDNEGEKFQTIIEYPSMEYQLNLFTQDPDHNYYRILLQFLENPNEISDEIISNYDRFFTEEYSEITKENIIIVACNKYDVTTENELKERLLKEDENLRDVVYLNQVKYYKSNILMFYNEAANIVTAAHANGIRLEVDKSGYNGIYFLYDRKNKITTLAEAQLKRTLYADISSLELDGNEVEEKSWFIPIGNSMIDYSIQTNDSFVILNSVNGEHIFQESETIKGATHYKVTGDTAYFRIKDTYNINYINNTIYFQANKNGEIKEASYGLSFGPKGSHGIEYTFLLIEQEEKRVNGENILVEKLEKNPLKLGSYKQIILTPKLIDSVGKEVYIYDNNDLTYTLHGVPYYKDNLSIVININSSTTINDLAFALIKAELNNQKASEQNLTLFSYYPIVTTTLDGDLLYFGTTSIMYDNLGGSPEYYKDKHKIVLNGEELKDLIWEINCPEEQKQFFPKFSADGYLSVPNLYMEGLSENVSIQAKRILNNGKKEVVFNYPLRIYQDVYTSSVLNSWDGKLTKDEKNGTILSSAIGAGKKDDNNTFSGVFLGNATIPINDNPDEEKDYFGIMGYNKSEPSFGFNIDGTAFIGKSKSGGQIIFNGNQGFIETNGYKSTNTEPQMRINLAEGSISCESALKSGSTARARVLLDPGSTQGLGLFLITDSEDHPLFNIKEKDATQGSQDEFFLQSQDYAVTSGLQVKREEYKVIIPATTTIIYEPTSENKRVDVSYGERYEVVQYDALPSQYKNTNYFTKVVGTSTDNADIEDDGEIDDETDATVTETESGSASIYYTCCMVGGFHYNTTITVMKEKEVEVPAHEETRERWVLDKSNNYKAGAGFKIDLKAGVIDAYNFNLNATITNAQGNKDNFFKIQTGMISQPIFSLTQQNTTIFAAFMDSASTTNGVLVSNFTVSNQSTFYGTTYFRGTNNFYGTVAFTRPIIASNGATFSNLTVQQGISTVTLVTSGLLTAKNGLTVEAGTLTARGAVSMSSTLTVSGATTLQNALSVWSSLSVGGTITANNGVYIATGYLSSVANYIYLNGVKYIPKKITYRNGSNKKASKTFLVKA